MTMVCCSIIPNSSVLAIPLFVLLGAAVALSIGLLREAYERRREEKDPAPPDGLPSAEDLDRMADEEEIRRRTA
jgi:hypothetical protein